MYGYSFGTASANVWHHVDYEAMLYPGYTTYGVNLLSFSHPVTVLLLCGSFMRHHGPKQLLQATSQQNGATIGLLPVAGVLNEYRFLSQLQNR